MTDRNRRHNQHQARRQPQPQSGSLYSQQNTRSIYHGHPADNYSTSNYRHPSTTTTTTTTTSTIQSDERCTSSIGYSYLIAIVSSFLVVLGIYLSLTRFDLRFLYISLLGISVEATGACVYCLSNIRASRLARRKQRIESDEFIVNNGVNLGGRNNLGDINFNNTQLRHQVTTVTHILSNQTLTSGVVSNGVEPDHLDSAPSAINVNSNHQSATVSHQLLETGPSVDNNPHETTLSEVPEGQPAEEDDGGTEVVDSIEYHDTPVPSTSAQNSLPEELPKSPACPQSPGATSEDYSSSTGLLENRIEAQSSSNPVLDTACPSDLVAQINSLTSDIPNQSTSTTSASGPNDKHDLPTVSADLIDIRTPSTSNNENNRTDANSPDLARSQRTGGLVATSCGPVALEDQRRTVSNQHRPANVRRTLVMGLSGEEEMIEIDERDLDNMSIQPPPYESIANDNRSSP